MERKMKKYFLIALFAALMASFTACSENDGGSNYVNANGVVDAKYAKNLSIKEIALTTSPDIEEENLQAWAEGEQDFSLAMLNASIEKEEKNLVISPYGMHVALSMVQAGAGDEVFEEMSDVLKNQAGSREDTAKRNGEVYQYLRVLGGEGKVALKLANRVWSDYELELLPAYAKLLEDDFVAPIAQVKFKEHQKEIIEIINAWASENTNGLIKDIASEDNITADSILALASAVYFKGDWSAEFDKQHTSKADFTTIKGDKVQVDMMSQQAHMPVYEDEDYVAVEKNYVDEKFSMIMVMPKDAAKFADFRKDYEGEDFREMLNKMESKTLSFSMPKFKIDSELSEKVLKEMGLEKVFKNGLTKIAMPAAGELRIDSVAQNATIDVNEVGTEAAAATLVVVAPNSAPVVTVRLDKPFMYFIVAKESKAILFAGQKVL
jgi:serpin B